LHGVSGATRRQIICPQRHRATIYHIITWRVTELYGAHAVEVGEDAAKIVPAGSDTLAVQRRRSADKRHGLLSAPGGLAWRFCGDASAHGMPATSSRDQSPSNTMARHQTLRARTGVSVGEDAAKKKDGVHSHGYSLCAHSICGGLLTQES
jgi:hypothetical protein